MKKLIKTVTTMAITGATLMSVCNAAVILKRFDVSGGSIDVVGAIENEGRQINMLIADQNGNKGIYQSISGSDGGFTFDIDANEAWSGSYTATINTEDAETAEISFSGDGSYASYTEPAEPVPEESDMEMSGVAYGNQIHISGSLDKQALTDRNVTLVIYKDNAGAKIEKGDIKYIQQTVADENGNFGFDFTLLDDIRFYKAACFAGGENVSGSVRIAKTAGEYIVADVTVDINGMAATLNANLENLGVDTSNYMMIITAYDLNGMLIDVRQSSAKNIGAGETISDSLVLENFPSDTKTVKAMLWSVGETLIPLDSAATVNI